MATVRVKCKACNAMILPATAERNSGLCAHCAKKSPEQKARQSEFVNKLVSGVMWQPSETELASERDPFQNNIATWRLEPEYYSDRLDTPISQVIRKAREKKSGNVFLVSDEDSRQNLSNSEKYGVLEYQNDKSSGYLMAHTSHNLKEQVDANFHVDQVDPSCGVCLLWYPSRTHIPKELAFSIFESIVIKSMNSDVKWLDFGDNSYVGRGHS